LFYISNDK